MLCVLAVLLKVLLAAHCDSRLRCHTVPAVLVIQIVSLVTACTSAPASQVIHDTSAQELQPELPTRITEHKTFYSACAPKP